MKAAEFVRSETAPSEDAREHGENARGNVPVPGLLVADPFEEPRQPFVEEL